jgi:hypothetical protein
MPADLDTPAAAAVEPAANGDAGAAAADGSTPAVAAAAVANGDAAAASETEEKAAADAAERASFFKIREGEEPEPYARRVFERLFSSDIKEVLVMEVSGRVEVVFHRPVYLSVIGCRSYAPRCSVRRSTAQLSRRSLILKVLCLHISVRS